MFFSVHVYQTRFARPWYWSFRLQPKIASLLHISECINPHTVPTIFSPFPDMTAGEWFVTGWACPDDTSSLAQRTGAVSAFTTETLTTPTWSSLMAVVPRMCLATWIKSSSLGWTRGGRILNWSSRHREFMQSDLVNARWHCSVEELWPPLVATSVHWKKCPGCPPPCWWIG